MARETSRKGKPKTLSALTGMVCVAMTVAVLQAATWNDLAPYNPSEGGGADFWDFSTHPVVETTTGEALCSGSGIIDTRTYHRAYSNILSTFRTLPVNGTILYVR